MKAQRTDEQELRFHLQSDHGVRFEGAGTHSYGYLAKLHAEQHGDVWDEPGDSNSS